uniref:PHR domain-containing protein n=1 Tax=Angiostrongylus cantonensis TaxID=6313 RepID=A0A0K0DP79_ANGCA
LMQTEKCVNNHDWDFDKVQVEPLRNELERLESNAERKITQRNEVIRTEPLEQIICTIGQAESIEMEPAVGEEKVLCRCFHRALFFSLNDYMCSFVVLFVQIGRITELLSSLRFYRDRWSSVCNGFTQQKDTSIESALLSGAFLPYTGYYEQQAIVAHCLWSVRLLTSAHRLVSAAFGGFTQQGEVVFSSSPTLLCSATGYDASGKIKDLAIQTGRSVTSIPTSFSEGFNQADTVCFSFA